MQLILISRLIFSLNISDVEKQKLTACTAYGVQKSENIDLYEKLEFCKKRILKNDRKKRR